MHFCAILNYLYCIYECSRYALLGVEIAIVWGLVYKRYSRLHSVGELAPSKSVVVLNGQGQHEV